MARRRFSSFLVAVRENDRPPRALLGKVARLSARFNARLELLHVITLPYILPDSASDVETAKDEETTRRRAKLERVANRLRRVGIRVNCSVVWDFPAADAIVRHVLKTRPDVLFVESHHHSKLARWFVGHTDWELIRSCPCPLWMVKTSRMPDRMRVLAAIDPFHSHSKPAALDDNLLQLANIAAGNGRLGVAHFYQAPITMVAGGMGEPLWVAAPSSEHRRVQRRVADAVQLVAERFGVMKSDRVIGEGDAGIELPETVKRWRANLLVMGAVSRSALKRIFVGQTAERVIDTVHCDVLIVKPYSFKSPVKRRMNVALIPTLPM